MSGVSQFDTSHHQIAEHRETPPLYLSPEAVRSIKSIINSDRSRIGLRFDEDGRGIISSNQYVGIVGLPNGPTIEINPKETVSNFLVLLRYGENIRSDPIQTSAHITTGDRFIEAIAVLYEMELRNVLAKGLTREYEAKNESERYIRGRLRISDQLRYQQVAPTEFECRYQDYTYDTVINQAVLQATSVLMKLTQTNSVARRLRRHHDTLEGVVSRAQLSQPDLDEVDINRLNEYYETLLGLTKFVLNGTFVGELSRGTYSTCSLLINMNNIFEKIVERSASEAIEEFSPLSVATQIKRENVLIEKGLDVSIKPDLVIRDEGNSVVLVGDSKWKHGSPSNQDIYQILAYQQVFDCPGMLIYPKQTTPSIEMRSRTKHGNKLSIVELPLSSQYETTNELGERLKARVSNEFNHLLDTVMA